MSTFAAPSTLAQTPANSTPRMRGPVSGALAAKKVRAMVSDRAPGVVEHVRGCLREQSPALKTCIVAAARLRMVSATALVREVVRRSSDPQAIALAARTLGAWYDRHSAALLFDALARNRGGDLARPHLLEGWLSLHPKHEGRYLRWLWEHAATPRASLEFATRLMTRTHGNEPLARRLRHQLLEAWEGWRSGTSDRKAPDGAGNAAALRVAWALFADPAGCRTMFRRAGLAQGQGFKDPLLRRLKRRRCRPFLPRHKPIAVDTRLPVPSLPEWTSTFPPDDWTSVAAWRQLRRPARFKAMGVRTLERLYRDLEVQQTPPPTLGLSQPAWWPESILLTVDDGPRPDVLNPLLDTLERHGVKAVFFLVGSQLTRSLFEAPKRTRQVLKRLVGGGHAVGFHSMNHAIRLHRHLLWRERDQIADAVRAFEALFNGTLKASGVAPTRILWARLPGGQGRLKPWVDAGLRDGGVSGHVHWELGGHGWGQRTSLRKIRAIARQACLRHGRGQAARVLLHESFRSGRQVDAFIDEVRRRCGVGL